MIILYTQERYVEVLEERKNKINPSKNKILDWLLKDLKLWRYIKQSL